MANPVCGGGGWDQTPIAFMLFLSKEVGGKESTVRPKVASIRYTHLANGEPDFAPYSDRIMAPIKVIAKAVEVNAERPFNFELLEWLRIHLVKEGPKSHIAFGASAVGFFSLLRIPEIRNVEK